MKKVYTTKNLLISGGFILAGLITFAFNKGLGFCLAGIGIFLLILYKSGYKFEGDPLVYEKKSVDLCRGCKDSLVNYINGTSNQLQIKEGSEGGCIRIDFFYNGKTGKSYIQLYTFSDYTYKKDGDLIALDASKATTLLKAL